MNKSLNADFTRGQPPFRRGLCIAVTAVLLGTVGAVFIHFRHGSSEPMNPRTEGKGQRAEAGGQRSEVRYQKSEVRGQAKAAAYHTEAANQPAVRLTALPASLPEPTPQTRQLVNRLSLLDQTGSPVTAEQATEWKRDFQQLVQHGRDAVPAITEFLKQNKDVSFDTSISDAMGYASVRRGMIDALAQIGGSEAVLGTLQILQTTADPHEIALLARNLDKMAPEEHRQEALQAAREALAMAAESKLEGTDVAPLFEVLHRYGDASVVPDLEQGTKQWNYYGAIALAQLPDGAGIPALIQIAQNNAGAKGNALEMLTQLASQYPDARAALLEMVRANKIASNLWPYLTPLLAGDQYHYQDTPSENSLPSGKRTASTAAYVVFGNQHFYTAPDLARLTPEDINQRMALIDEIQSASSDPSAASALQRARELLNSRMPQTVAASQ